MKHKPTGNINILSANTHIHSSADIQKGQVVVKHLVLQKPQLIHLPLSKADNVFPFMMSTCCNIGQTGLHGDIKCVCCLHGFKGHTCWVGPWNEACDWH